MWAPESTDAFNARRLVTKHNMMEYSRVHNLGSSFRRHTGRGTTSASRELLAAYILDHTKNREPDTVQRNEGTETNAAMMSQADTTAPQSQSALTVFATKRSLRPRIESSKKKAQGVADNLRFGM